MTECPICRRRPCAVKGCIRQARSTDVTCWHHSRSQPCGCPVGEGHTCRPPFAEKWED